METLLYASAQRQIRKAIDFIGIKSKTNNLALFVIANEEVRIKEAVLEVRKRAGKEPNEGVLELSESKVKRIRVAFRISDNEIGTIVENGEFKHALVNIIIERMALLSTQL